MRVKAEVYRGVSFALSAAMCAGPGLRAQAAAGQAHVGGEPAAAAAGASAPAYDVVSVKVDKSGSGGMSWGDRGGSYQATNVGLKMLLSSAYDIREDLISGVPGVFDGTRFDVQAKVGDTDAEALKKITAEQRRTMMLGLLEDRFRLKAHVETKVAPIYELVVVKSGAKLTQAAAPPPVEGDAVQSTKRGGMPPGSMNFGPGQLTGSAIPLEQLVSFLASQLQRTVVDKTGLAGKYDLVLKYTPEGAQAAAADAGPSVFTALEEQLGLKLQNARGPVDTLVIDHVEMPSAN